ncbi:MAG: EVE domain-containing protein [Chitinophagaceae bacterium]|nr:EVE domain-containing protein [Oligoflexus sp.]
MSDGLYWLMKTEPDTFSFDDLLSRPQQTEGWEGVRNYMARNFMRDQFKVGQLVFFYHSRIEEPAIVGVAQIVKEAYPDEAALDLKSPYFDAKSLAKGESRWCMVDVKAYGQFERPITLKELKSTAVKDLQNMALIKPGQRLSIQPVTKKEWDAVLKISLLKRI